MVYHVGSPAMFDGNMFLPDTGMPIWKSERSRTRLAVWLPEPLTVATWMLKSLMIRRFTGCAGPSWAATSVGAIQGSFRGNKIRAIPILQIIAKQPEQTRRRYAGRRLEPRYPRSACLTAVPKSAGLLTTWTPALDSAVIFSAAVPFPPEMIAPA